MNANNNEGRREGMRERFAREYDRLKFNSALVEQGASLFKEFEACECARVFKFIFNGAYKVLQNNTDF